MARQCVNRMPIRDYNHLTLPTVLAPSERPRNFLYGLCLGVRARQLT